MLILDLAGHALPAGAPVLIDIEGINTDPARHTGPLAHRPDRGRRPHLSFGDGPHVCIGAQLALLEARCLLEVLDEEYPRARLAVDLDDLMLSPGDPSQRQVRHLPVVLEP